MSRASLNQLIVLLVLSCFPNYNPSNLFVSVRLKYYKPLICELHEKNLQYGFCYNNVNGKITKSSYPQLVLLKLVVRYVKTIFIYQHLLCSQEILEIVSRCALSNVMTPRALRIAVDG